MSEFICHLSGNRGRSMDVYDNKAVITTDVTLGSLIANNATDGKKTIFYADVVGIQFKKCGFTIGYLQLETPSAQMNNLKDNHFSENTFTYGDKETSALFDELMEKVHDYIVDRIEGYKYNVPVDNKSLYALVNHLESHGGAYASASMRAQVKNMQTEEEAQRRKEAEEKREQERQQTIREMNDLLAENEGKENLVVFLEKAESCTRIAEILTLWEAINWEEGVSSKIKQRILDAEKAEHLYGASVRRVQNLIKDILEIARGIESENIT